MLKECNAAATSKSNITAFELWHKRLGHVNVKDLSEAIRKGVVKGFKMEKKIEQFNCEICTRGKMTRRPFPKMSNRETSLFDIIHTDICGPMRENSNGGNKYYFEFIDDHSKWCEVRFLKSRADVFNDDVRA